MSQQSAAAVPWVEKYRPSNLGEMHGHAEILTTIQRFLHSGQLPNLLLHGPAGTGKTTAAVAVCKQVFGNKNWRLSVLELNASDDRGIDVVRNQIKQFAQTKSFGSFTFAQEDANEAAKHGNGRSDKDLTHLVRSSFKFIILDEADSMTNQAQFALRRMIEQYSHNVRFFIICNYAHKIIPALVSRCTSFRFAVLPPEHTRDCLNKVCHAEKVSLDDKALVAFQRVSKGDLRKTLNLLQGLVIRERARQKMAKTFSEDVEMASDNDLTRISDHDVYHCVGEITPAGACDIVSKLFQSTDYEEMMDLLLNQNYNKANGSSSTSATQRSTRSLMSLLPALHEAFLQLEFPTVDSRLRLMGALATCELRFCHGNKEDELEAAFLVNEIMTFRNMVGGVQ